MQTYLIFIYGSFEDEEDIEYFCMEVLGSSKNVISLKYVVDNLKNIIVIFESGVSEDKVMSEMSSLLNNENIAFYFMFNKEDLLLSFIPEQMRDLLFKSTGEIIKINVSTQNIKKSYNLDEILEKIDTHGIESLTPEEKKFLDNFEN
jgi:signal recognition particle receptor subunit beta